MFACPPSLEVPALGVGAVEADFRRPEGPGHQMDHLLLHLHRAGNPQKRGGPEQGRMLCIDLLPYHNIDETRLVFQCEESPPRR